MNFKTFLSEAGHRERRTLDQAVELAKEHATAALSNIEAPIWRGASEGVASYLIDPSGSSRASAHTENYYTVILDEVLPAAFPRRSKSIICSNNAGKHYAASYASGGALYAIFPYDATKIGLVAGDDMWRTRINITPFGSETDGTNYRIEDWNRRYAEADISDYSYDSIVDGIEATITDPSDKMYREFVKIFDAGHVDHQLRAAYGKRAVKDGSLSAATGATFDYFDPADREVWVGGPAIAVRENMLRTFMEKL